MESEVLARQIHFLGGKTKAQNPEKWANDDSQKGLSSLALIGLIRGCRASDAPVHCPRLPPVNYSVKCIQLRLIYSHFPSVITERQTKMCQYVGKTLRL